MGSDELAPLEAYVETQVKHLKAVAGVVRELRSAEEQYGQEYTELPFDLSADVKSTLERLPHLQRVSQGFSHFVYKCSVVKAAVAEDLMKKVIVPLEVYTANYVEKTRHLLSELYELLQKEKAFDLAYENLRQGCENDKSLLQLHCKHRDQLLRKRDTERLAIQQWVTALQFAGQRYEAHVRNVLCQIRVVYERMIAALTALIQELREQLNQDANALPIDTNGDKNCAVESWECFMAEFDCHVAITSWMSDLFKQVIPVEHKAAKSLQKAKKLDRALCKSFGGVEFSSQFSGLLDFHDLLTVNIANPIIRTLKFTQERQERMRNELLKLLEETRTLVIAAQVRLAARRTKDQVVEKNPVRCDSWTSSETSEVEDNNEEDENFNGAALKEAESSQEQFQLETLEKKQALQRQEMTRVLEQTSYLAVKTMELMVQDYLKHVTKALTALGETIRAEPQETQANRSPQLWNHIAKRLSIIVCDQPALPVEKYQHNQNPRRCSIPKNISSPRRHRMTRKTTRGVGEPSAVQVLLSFVQSAVGLTYWVVDLVFKTAKAQLPHSSEQRAVLAVFAVMIFTLASICMKSNQLQNSWSDLIETQHSNSEDLVHIVKLSLQVCSRGTAEIPTST